jgi:hypothetical protein
MPPIQPQKQLDLVAVMVSCGRETHLAVKAFRAALALSTTGVEQRHAYRFQVLDELFQGSPAVPRP